MTIKFSEDIVPLSSLKINPGKILSQITKTHRPVLVTSRGRGVAVVQSLKDYEEEEGFIVKNPRDAIKQAYQAGLISEGHIWMDALKDRNLTTHTYHERVAVEIEEKIRNAYFPILEALYLDFRNKVSK